MPLTFIFGRKRKSCWSRRTDLERFLIVTFSFIGIAALIGSAVCIYFYLVGYEIVTQAPQTKPSLLVSAVRKVWKKTKDAAKAGKGLVKKGKELVSDVMSHFQKIVSGISDFIQNTISSVVKKLTDAMLTVLQPWKLLPKFPKIPFIGRKE